MRRALIGRIAAKELTLFFSSPVGYLFLLAFLAVTLFVFFWGEAFFARNVADVRPMFEWMPVLLAFLGAALTMVGFRQDKAGLPGSFKAIHDTERNQKVVHVFPKRAGASPEERPGAAAAVRAAPLLGPEPHFLFHMD